MTLGTVRSWPRSEPTFVAAYNAARETLENRPCQALAALGDRAVAVVREALNGFGDPVELRAAVEVVRLRELDEPGPARPTTPADAERAIGQRRHTEILDDLLTFASPSWGVNGDPEDDEDAQ
jgi:hypothetical protein